MITGSSARTIDSKVFLGSSHLRGELVSGGVPTNKILIPAYPGQAYSLIRECGGVIQAAVLGEYLVPREDRERINALHSSFKRNNPQIQIYHMVSKSIVDHFAELEKAGLARLNIAGLLPSNYQGKPDHNPLYLLGKDLAEKYFLSQ